MNAGVWDLQYVVSVVLQLVTIVVLIFTCVAAFKQATAAHRLTEATERQIKTSVEQAEAAKEQVHVARRQITESLRPILTAQVTTKLPNVEQMEQFSVTVKNEGAGVALDVWWAYGKPGDDPTDRNRIQDGILAPGTSRSFLARQPRTIHEGLVIVYESLSGIASGTGVAWIGGDVTIEYYPDLDDWAKGLLGRVLGPSR